MTQAFVTEKLLLEELCDAAGIQIQLHTRVVAAQVDGEATIRAVLTESRSGRQAWTARVFIDCTGDGDLARHAGCGFDLGHPETGDLQPASMTVLVTGLRFEELEPFVGGVHNLMMAGRCINGDFFAHSSYRVTGNAAAMGEAAGAVAALAAHTGTRPADHVINVEPQRPSRGRPWVR